MKRWSRLLLGVILTGGGTLAFAPPARAESARLQLKRLEPIARSQSYTSDDYVFRRTRSQSFSRYSGAQGDRSSVPGFAKAVKKEPTKYVSKKPFRGVATLGSRQYGFVLDAKDAKATGYDRLYFDLNHNGDLTDDKVIEGESDPRYGSPSYSYHHFPRIDLTTDAGGVPVDCALLFSVYSRSSSSRSYAYARLYSGAYRQGEIVLNGKSHRIAVLDYNSNGRFDDEIKLDTGVRRSDGRMYAVSGDMLLVDYVAGDRNWQYGGMPAGQHLSKLVAIDGQFYDVELSAAGDEITLTRSKLPVGKITNPNKGFRAIVHGKHGFLDIRGGGESGPVALPAGDWTLYSYVIDRTGDYVAKPDQAQGQQEGSSLLSALASALLQAAGSVNLAASTPRYTIVSAQGTKDCQPVTVRAGKTVAFPFGPPYKPTVTGDVRQGAKSARLGLALVGSAGELCTNLRVNGGRPAKPEFTITTADGKKVVSGNFEYG